METNVPGKRESRKKVAIRKVVNGEIDVWFCGMGEVATCRGARKEADVMAAHGGAGAGAKDREYEQLLSTALPFPCCLQNLHLLQLSCSL